VARRTVCKIIDKVRRLHKDLEKAEEKSSAAVCPNRRGAGNGRCGGVKDELFEALQEMRLNKKQMIASWLDSRVWCPHRICPSRDR